MSIIRTDLTQPSSTITAATLAGLAVTLLTEIALQMGADLRPSLAVALNTFVVGLVGYLTRETVWPRQMGLTGENDENEAGV